MLVTDWRAEFDKLNEYRVSLERDRSNLWSVNQELRDKIGMLERAMLMLQGQWTEEDETQWQSYLEKCRAQESNLIHE